MTMPVGATAPADHPAAHIPFRALTLALIGLLVVGLGAAVLVANTRHVLRTDTRAALEQVRYRLETHAAPATMADALRLAQEIGGQRLLTAQLIGPSGPSPVPARPPHATVPPWFQTLLSPDPARMRHPLPTQPPTILQISTDAGDELAHLWGHFRIILPALLVLAPIGVGLAWLLARALRHRPRPPAANALLASADAERTRIAHDLHDEIGPRLFALSAAATAAQRLAADRNDADLSGILASLCRHADALRHSTRHAIRGLHPALTADATLSELLAGLMSDLRDMAPDARIMLDLQDQPPPLAPDAHLCVLRFLRESALNALRHGDAASVRLIITLPPDGGLIAQVSDNGHGPGRARPGIGQTGMQQRAQALGAEYLPPWRDGRLTHTQLRIPRP